MEKLYNLSAPQKSILLMEQFYNGTSINNIGGGITVHEALDFDIFKKAINNFVKYNDSFRIRLKQTTSGVKQYFEDFCEFDIPIIDLKDETEVTDLDKKILSQPFHIFDEALFQFTIFRFPNHQGGYVIKMHHLISDAWTSGLLCRKIMHEYSNLLNGNTQTCNAGLSYQNYLETEQDYFSSTKFEKDKLYWQEKFTTVPTPVTVPSVVNSSDHFSCDGNRVSFVIPKKDMEQITHFCTKHSVSVFNFFMATLSTYLSKTNDVDDLVVGTPILNRANVKEKNTAGMFVNTAALRVSFENKNKFTDLISAIAKDSMGLLRHQKYPYQTILEDVRKKDASIPNLYHVVLSYQITRSNHECDISYDTRWSFNGCVADDIDVHLYDMDEQGILNVAYDYKMNKYTENDIENMHYRFMHIIKQVLENDEILVNEIEIVTPEEKNRILFEFNHTSTDNSKGQTIVDLFEEQAEKYPNKPAVVFEKTVLTYQELNEKANRIAHSLRENGITNQDVVCILLNRSLDLITAIYGVIKSGATYVIIDATFPEERIHYIMNDSHAKCCITHTAFKEFVNLENSIYINGFDFSSDKTENLNITYDNNFSIIYTSGSTGTPKGVILNKSGYFNLLNAFDTEINLSTYKNILGIATVSFDMFAFELFSATMLGNTFIFANEEEQKNPILMSKLIKQNHVDFFVTTPSRVELLLRDECENPLENVKTILLGGEKLTHNLYSQLQAKTNANIYNSYGPTEVTSACTNNLVSSEDISIGKPLPNTQVYILDGNHHLLPIGITGEICVAGSGISNGYLNNEEATAKNFIKNPFGNGYLYKTGDLGKFNENGKIDYVDRLDNQVKIRGLRIELGEIESKISKIPEVTSCAVIKIVDHASHELLCGYFTANTTIEINTIRNHLEKFLPKYMIPQYFMQMEKLPFSHNGKIDRKKLPKPQFKNEQKDIILPRNETDKKLIELLKEILNINCISLDNSFFELGGDSLSAINLCIEIENAFHKQVFVKDILEAPSIEELSNLIEKNDTIVQKQMIKLAPKAEYYPTSSAQKRIYFASQVAGSNSTLYNAPGSILLEGKVAINKLEECLKTLIKRHETLRTYFEVINKKVMQKIVPDIDFKLEVQNNVNFEKFSTTFENFVKPFDLSIAPLFRAKFVGFTNGKSALLLDMHHIISDGTSMNIFVDELCKLYNGNTLNDLTISYKDFAVFENEALETGKLDEAEKYWLKQFENELPVLNLPTTYSRPALQSFEGKKVHSVIPAKTVQKIEKISEELAITPYMLLLSVYYVLLSKYTSQEDIIVGSPVVGRDILETYDLIGMFVNTLALRNNVSSHLTFQDFVLNVKENVLNSYQFQTYPFDELVNKLNLKRDTSRNPLFDTMFIYQNNGFKDFTFNNIKSEYYLLDTNISKFDLSLEVMPNQDEILLSFEYATKLFEEEFIKNLSNHYLNILNTVLDNMHTKISEICMLSETERDKIVYEFNRTKVDFPEEKTLSVLFEEQVKKTPNNIAIAFENEQLTFRELNEKANSLAYYLRNHGIHPNDLVGIMVSRSLEMIVAILAVLKSGGAYIPIDPTYPNDRIDYMLTSSNAKILLTQNKLNDKLNFKTKVMVDLSNNDIYSLPNKNLENVNLPTDLFYIIFTSGSTGKPKGVMMMHKTLSNFTNYCNNYVDYLKNPTNKTILSITTISFDIFVYETLISLQKGIKVVISNENEQTSPTLLNQLIEKHNVQIMQSTPSIMQIFVNNISSMPLLKNIKYITLAGEQLPLNLVNTLHKLCKAKIYNGYGPSETNYATLTEMNDTQITIGKPLYNNQIYLLDKHLKPVPIGVIGEIYIAGYGVAKGYLNNPELTQKSFLPNPFIPGETMYKSGDLGVFQKDGNILCLGRSDFQVKIRGLRIELGEIETLILKYPNIKKAVVIKQTIQNREFVSAYFVADKRISTNELRKYLSGLLPRYMVPSYFIALDDLPYTLNGKIDRKNLPLPNKILNVGKEEYVAPQTKLQKQLVNLWEKILNVNPIGIHDNFFELGGDSLLAMNLNVELLKISNKLNYSDIFRFPTVAEQEEKINSDESKPIFSKIENLSDHYVDILKNNKKRAKIKQWHPANVLLTGSTGFLGIHILEEFIKHETGKIYCIVRDEPGLTAKAKLHQKLNYYFGDKYDLLIDNRIFAITGTISEPGFGLNQEDLLNLTNSVDVIINSAARVAHFGNYDDFYKSNVKSVKYMIDFCQKFKKKLYHISTIGVSGLSPDTSYLLTTKKRKWFPKNKEKNILFDEAQLYIGQVLENVYARTKFEAESYVLDAISKGLDGYILRMGNLMPRYRDGLFQENLLDNAFVNRLASFIKIGVLPNYILQEQLEFTPIDYAAKAVYNLITHPTNVNRIFHVSNSKTVSITSFLKVLQKQNFSIEVLDENTFKQKIHSILQKEETKKSLNYLLNDLNSDFHFNKRDDIKIESKFTIKYLRKTHFYWPKISNKYLVDFINLLRKVI